VVIAVRAARAVQVTADDVVDVVTVRKRFMTAVVAVFVSGIMAAAGMTWCAFALVAAIFGKAMFVYMIFMDVVQVAVVKIVGVTIVLNGLVSAIGSVLVLMGTMCSAAHPNLLQQWSRSKNLPMLSPV
jgi:hypothetical protein